MNKLGKRASDLGNYIQFCTTFSMNMPVEINIGIYNTEALFTLTVLQHYIVLRNGTVLKMFRN